MHMYMYVRTCVQCTCTVHGMRGEGGVVPEEICPFCHTTSASFPLSQAEPVQVCVGCGVT